MSSPLRDAPLSRAISEIDLNAALNNVKKQVDNGLRYTKDQIIRLRTGTEKNIIDHVEFADIARPDQNGVVTPPYLAVPKVPPSTPAIPFTPAGAAETESEDDGTVQPVQVQEQKKSSGNNKKPPITGYEEFYADPPITPEEYKEERDLYSDHHHIANRLETCIQRYRARRKLDGVRANVLTKYLMLGGVEAATSKGFTGGLDKATIEDSTADEIIAMRATDYISTANAKFYDGSENWVVDFEGVAKGFFSYRLTHMLPIDNEKDLITYTAVVRNFLNYVLMHAVCPEYTKDIMNAKKICDLAENELWAIKRIERLLPGDFNVAASTLYGGHYENSYAGDKAWATEQSEWDDFASSQQGFSVPEAERIFKTSIALCSKDETLFDEVMKPDVRIVETEKKCYEVVGIERAATEMIKQYATVKNVDGEVGSIKPLGMIKFKPWEGTGIYEEDCSDDEGAELSKGEGEIIESFWLEDEVLELCYVGLKLEAMVHELSCGIKFFDAICGLYCSFFTYLPQEKMIHWKEPAPNTRPPPTVDDLEVEERVMGAIIEEDVRQDEKIRIGK